MFGLSDKDIKSIIDVIASIPEIEEAIVYGSRARGDYKPSSDIDLSCRGNNITTTQMAMLDDLLDQLLLPFFFDTNHYEELKNQDLIDRIDREGTVIFSRKG